MKSFFRKSIAAVLTLGILFGILGGSIVYADAEDYEQSSLGALAACARHTLGAFSGVPACVNENGDLHVCENNFPDNVFREYVANLQGAEDGYFTPEECNRFDQVNVHNYGVHTIGIRTLQGIEFFTRLESLGCSGNNLSELNLSNNTALTKLSCQENHIQKLNISGCTKLDYLDCAVNSLMELNISNNKDLVYVNCLHNELTELDVYNNLLLAVLNCNQNNLIELDVSNNIALLKLLCSDNQLTELDINSNTELTYLECFDNQLTKLDTSNNMYLEMLWCSDNFLTQLNISGKESLQYLYCSQNYLTELNVTSDTALNFLDCSDNQLTELDTSNNTALENLYCHDNQLTKLDLTFNTELQYLNCDNNQLTELVIIYYHKSLASLSCNNNQLTKLYLGGGSELKSLECSSNQLTELNLSDKPGLNRLACADNQLTALDLSNCYYLYELICYNNSITRIEDRANSGYIGKDVLEISPQIHTLPLTQKGSVWTVDLHALGDSRAIYGIREDSLSEGILDKNTGLVTFTEKPTSFTFESSSGARYLMQVVIHLTDGEWSVPNPDLGASSACAGHVLNMFSGVPACVDTCGDLHICENNFPDDVFRDHLSIYRPDGYITQKDCICFSNKWDLSHRGIKSLKGIEFFVSLTGLRCECNQLTELDVSNNTALVELSCSENQLTELDVSNNTALRELFCYENQLTKLDVSKNLALSRLACSNNQLTELDMKNCMNLLSLDCSNNQLTSLDVSNNPNLCVLYCSNNHIAELFTNSTNGNWRVLDVSPQISTLPLVKDGDVWTADLGSLIANKDDITRIYSETVSEGKLDLNTGLVTFKRKPTSFTYECYIGKVQQTMQVTIRLTEPEATYKATINGAEYEYAAGEEVTITADAFYLDGNWGYRFDTWTGDVDAVADVKSSTTAFTMPAQDVTITANHYLIGDVDGSGVVDAVDAAAIIRMANGTMTPTLAGDITGTGVVDAMSAANIARYIAGTYTPVK